MKNTKLLASNVCSRLLILLGIAIQSTFQVAFAGTTFDVPSVFVNKASHESGYTRNEVLNIFSGAIFKPKIIEIMDRPGESLPWSTYEAMVVTPAKIMAGRKFLAEHASVLEKAERTYFVPKEVVAAIIGVESGYGANKGRVRALDALMTLSFKYPRRERFFQSELIEFLMMTKREGIEPLSVLSSYAGAMGWPQFMPSSIRKLAVDFDGDGHVDIIGSVDDAVGSVANYLNKSGWDFRSGVVEEVDASGDLVLVGTDGHERRLRTLQNFQVILKYNQSKMYAMAVFELSQAIK